MITNLSQLPGRIRYWMTPLLEHCPDQCFPVRERRVQVYVVGMPRSGTVSLYDIFKKYFRADHEPESRFFTSKIVDYRLNRIDEQEMRRYLRHRDRRLGLELDTSYLNGEVVSLLASEFPDARFILTIRDCLSWTDSILNFLMNKPEFMTSRKPHIRRHMEVQFGLPPYEYAPEEEILKRHGLHPLARYLTYWSEHNRRVMDLLPPERLLIIKTKDIGNSSDAIEKFLGLPPNSLDKAVHSNSASARHSVLDQIPRDFVRAQVEACCGELMRKFFPDAMERL